MVSLLSIFLCILSRKKKGHESIRISFQEFEFWELAPARFFLQLKFVYEMVESRERLLPCFLVHTAVLLLAVAMEGEEEEEKELGTLLCVCVCGLIGNIFLDKMCRRKEKGTTGPDAARTTSGHDSHDEKNDETAVVFVVVLENGRNGSSYLLGISCRGAECRSRAEKEKEGERL